MKTDRAKLNSQIHELIKQHAAKADAIITEETRLDELGVDSIDLMEIIFRLEEEYGVEISVEGLAGRETLGDIVDYAFKMITA